MAGLRSWCRLLAGALVVGFAFAGAGGGPPAAAAGPSISYPDFSSVAGLELTGTARQVGSVLQLTDTGPSETATAFATTPMDVTHSFESQFRFNLFGGTNPPGDGITFTIQSAPTGPNTTGVGLGATGGGLGYDGIKPSVAVEFDTFPDGFYGLPFNNNHVAFLFNGVINDQAAVDPGFPLFGSGPANVWVDYTADSHLLQVYASPGAAKPSAPLTSFTVDLAGLLGPSAWAGFTGATGGSNSFQDILSWQVTTADTTPPTTQASLAGTSGSNGWYVGPVTLTLTATDPDDAAASLVTKYSTDGGAAWQTYDSSSPPVFSQDGAYTVQYYSVDPAGNQEGTKSISFKIDQTAPACAVTMSPNVLWPPNHQMVPVTASVTIADGLSGAGSYVLTGITNSEGAVAGQVSGFQIGQASTTGALRAERAGSGPGRVYTLTYQASDLAGNTTTCFGTVTVPHDQGH